MRILQQANNVFVKSTRVSNSFSNLEDGITYIPFLDSGSTYLTKSNVTNNATVTTDSYACIYSRVGNVVTMTLPIEVQMDSLELNTSFNLSLPIGSSFTGVKQAYGVACPDLYLDLVTISSDDTNSSLYITVTSKNNGDAFSYLTLNIQYLVI
jgi:hypothetical protein